MSGSGSDGPQTASGPARRAPRRASARGFYLWSAAAALVIAGALALFASTSPDGLEKVAESQGFADTAQRSPLAGSPLADYQAGGPQAEGTVAQRALAGIAGVAVVAGLGLAVFGALAKHKQPELAEPLRRAGDASAHHLP